MTALLISLIIQYSNQYNIDPQLVVAVIENESSFKISARGKAGEVGLMQLLPSSFPGYTISQLEDPKTNIKLGIGYLSKVKSQCKHKNGNEWIVCYNVGPYRANKIKHPKLFPYYKKVHNIMHKFKQGQAVMVKKMHNLTVDGFGVFMGVSESYHHKGYYKIQNEFGAVMLIEPERVVSEDTYWKEKKNVL